MITTPRTRTANLRGKALAYLRDGRLAIDEREPVRAGSTSGRIRATIIPAPGDRSGLSVEVEVRCTAGVWTCTDHPGANSCSHRLAAQLVTGHGHLGGRWQAGPPAPTSPSPDEAPLVPRHAPPSGPPSTKRSSGRRSRRQPPPTECSESATAGMRSFGMRPPHDGPSCAARRRVRHETQLGTHARPGSRDRERDARTRRCARTSRARPRDLSGRGVPAVNAVAASAWPTGWRTVEASVLAREGLPVGTRMWRLYGPPAGMGHESELVERGLLVAQPDGQPQTRHVGLG
ncbi:hypothetical protein FAIPA1_130139 [Frankia sp. AiPs1]